MLQVVQLFAEALRAQEKSASQSARLTVLLPELRTAVPGVQEE
jgi:hypothetical protein